MPSGDWCSSPDVSRMIPHFRSLEKAKECSGSDQDIKPRVALQRSDLDCSIEQHDAREASLIFHAFERLEKAASVQAVVPCHHSADPCKSPSMHVEVARRSKGLFPATRHAESHCSEHWRVSLNHFEHTHIHTLPSPRRSRTEQSLERPQPGH